ncbi:MAG: hypothetical protein JXA71_18085, partial [Chitinispirillaceae bacterium]|nr:hypothetical protein [Chitinispirillaceae bacterium]
MKTKSILPAMLLLSLLFSSASMAKIGVIVNKDLYPAITPAVTTYVSDLIASGKQVWLDATTFNSMSSPSSLRDTLISHRAADNLEGAVFIGDLPIVNYETIDDFGSYGEFPFDLYFMDLDCQWRDDARDGDWDGNAKTGWIDGHVPTAGVPQAEIWVSRVIGSVVPGLGSEAAVTGDYLNRLHVRMMNSAPSPQRMLICGYDVDWPEL